MQIDFRDLEAAAQAQDRLTAADLLAHRQRMCAATAVPESAVVFIVPPWTLIGVTEVGGSPVIHSVEVSRPGIVLPVPEVPPS